MHLAQASSLASTHVDEAGLATMLLRAFAVALVGALLIGLWRRRRLAPPAAAAGWRLIELSALVLLVSTVLEDVPDVGTAMSAACGAASLGIGLVGVVRRLRAQVAGLTLDAMVESAIVSFVGGAIIWMLVAQPRLTDHENIASAAGYTAGVMLASVLALSVAWLAAIEPMRRGVAVTIAAYALSYLGEWGRKLAVDVGAALPAQFGGSFAAIALVAAVLAGTLIVPGPPLQPDDITPVFRRRIVVIATGAGPILTAIALADRHRTSWLAVLVAAATLAVLEVVYLLRFFERRGQLERLAQRDELTGLPNRRLFDRRLREAHALARVTDASLSVALIDLDRFKVVNDDLGHAVGDELLRAASRRIAVAAGDNNLVARLGGDEFTVLMVGARREGVLLTAQSILHTFREPFVVQDYEIFITPSIGIAHYPDDGENPRDLLRSADVAMYRAKERGRNLVHEAAGCANRAVDRVALETDLRYAIERDELIVHYQPRIDLLSGTIVGAEALVRWNHAKHGLLPPDDFIPLAEDTGLIGGLGEWVLTRACEQAAKWRAMTAEFTMAVNVSSRQFENDNLPTTVAAVLRTSRLDPTCLELELTESLALQDSERIAGLLGEIRDMGVRCSIDDFGIGYSGLHYLDRFPITAIKIDRSFVNPVSEERPASPIVSGVIALARGLGIEVVAEGVETRQQADFLIGEGCDQAQGFYYGQPLPPEEFEDLLLLSQEEPEREAAPVRG
jgi:diguanylate cyclase (GGDEF)-like protein